MNEARFASPLHVDVAGEGPPLVLLHGFAMHGGLFAPIVPSLRASHRVHVVDLPGHGRSAPIASFDLPSLVDAIDPIISPDEPVRVVAWSLGGLVALEWARRKPSRIARLVLVTTTPSFVARDRWPDAMSDEALVRFGDELRVSYRLTLQRFLALQVHGSDEGRATLATLRERLFDRGEPSPRVLADALALLRSSDLRGALPGIETPTLVVGGERDAIVPVAATRRLAAAMPRATHVTIAGGAHAPFLSHPRTFADSVLPFLDG